MVPWPLRVNVYMGTSSSPGPIVSRQGRAGSLPRILLPEQTLHATLEQNTVGSHAEHNHLKRDQEHGQSKAHLALVAERAKVRARLHGDLAPAAGPAVDGVTAGVGGIREGHGGDDGNEAGNGGSEAGGQADHGTVAKLQIWVSLTIQHCVFGREVLEKGSDVPFEPC